MQKVTFHLQTITPLFMAGGEYSLTNIPVARRHDPYGIWKDADQGWKLQAEIRPPSFRGLMRYWIRAAGGGLIDAVSVSLDDIRQFEQSVFGATDQASTILLRLAGISKEPEQFEKEDEWIKKDDPPQVIRQKRDARGRNYLLWSMGYSGYGENYRFDRCYYPGGTQFEVTLTERTLDAATPSTIPFAVSALWLLVSLGGIGSRSHRCAGSLMIRGFEGDVPHLPFTAARNKEDLQEMLQRGICEIRRLSISHLQELKAHGGTPFTRPSFDSLLLPHAGDPSPPPYGCHIWILTQRSGLCWDTVKDAMAAVGRQLKQCRNDLLKMHSIEELTVLGLPLNVKSLGDRKLKKALQQHRRTSPLLLRLTELDDGKYVCVAVLFKTPTSPIMDDRNERILIPEPDYTLLEDWIVKAFHALEVKLKL